jgi:microcystin-dependent protein
MGLSRLDNFLKSVRGTILYVDPSSIDATDSIENQGNSLTRPFRTIQRALIESARFSYQRGLDNDRFGKTTILLYPGDHFVDNRPGWIPDGANNFRLRSGATSSDFSEWTLNTNLDLSTADNQLYKLNSIHGGVIIPRGTSIVGMDLRKTKIRPLYVPDPVNNNIERSCVFRVTGACYLWQFSIFDADPNGNCFKDYTTNKFVPNFSHHKLSGFEYADGVNNVNIADTFQTFETDRTDLDMYYEKVGIVYGDTSGRPISPDYPADEDLQPVIDEYRIVGSRGATVGITSIRSGDGVTGNTTITVTLEEEFPQLSVDTPIQINGVAAGGYDGQFVVSAVNSLSEIQYQVQNVPTNLLPGTAGATLNIAVDTVTSASPYIFNVSLRSVYGMCGLLSDGSKADGFKSMVVAQYTGIGLQKDDNAFVKYDSSSGSYVDSTAVTSLHTDSLARFKPEYENFHIKAINNAYLQLVSVFAIGFAEHFSVESGGDFSINNSNSNFGSKAFSASGFRKDAFPRDDVGYITHIISPKEIQSEEVSVDFVAFDIEKTVSAGATHKLYLFDGTDINNPPNTVIDGFRLGAKQNDIIYTDISSGGITTTYSARIIMPNTQYTASEVSAEKSFEVGRSLAGINSITSNVITLRSNHSFLNGESIRVISDNGHLPDGVKFNNVYYAITNAVAGIGSNQIKLAQNLNDAINDDEIPINSKGGTLRIVSRVSDKQPGDIGHPVGFDTVQGQWFVNVATATSENNIYTTLKSRPTPNVGDLTSRSYFKRTADQRSVSDTTYRVRYVLPKDSTTIARPPLDGYIIQESNGVLGDGTTEIAQFFNPSGTTLNNSTEFRNFRFIAEANWDGTNANIITELPHNLNVGSEVELVNILSTNNPTGIASSAFNGTHVVTGISSTKHFSFALSADPGSFSNNIDTRNSDLPYFKRKKLKNTYQIFKNEEVQPYIPGVQDGIYHLVLINNSNSPTITPFTNLNFSQPVQYLYPQTNRDNPNSDPEATTCFAVPDPIGQVIPNDPQKSITKETIQKTFIDFNVGFGVTNIVSTSSTSHTLFTTLDHGLSGITSVSIVNPGSGYVAGTYYNVRLSGPGTNGLNATARVSVSAGGTVTAVRIMDGGSAYGIGNTCTLVGVGTIGSDAVVQVANIYNHVGECLAVSGVSSAAYSGYNNLYKITGISNAKTIAVESSEPVNNFTLSGVGVTLTSNTNVVLTGKTLGISTFTYTAATGIGTLTFTDSHGFRVNNKLRIGGADNAFFNNDFIVSKVNNWFTVQVNVGIATTTLSTGGNITVYRPSLTSLGGDLTKINENVSGRLISEYAGISTALGADYAASASDTAPLFIANADTLGLNVGDFLLINDEIFRIKSNVTGNNFTIFRELFGTPRQNHAFGDAIRKIKPLPVELRRNSIIRASAHTFEYLGFGPGNYSTAFPERQDRILSNTEILLAQSTKTDGGITVYTGMDDRGNFFTGNRKLNSSTGREEIYDTPIPTVTGEDPTSADSVSGFDFVSTQEISASRSIKVEGGPDGNLVSEFDGPVVFNNKITSTSEKGLESKSLFIQGDADIARKFTVSIGSTPETRATPGDIITKGRPEHARYLGWIYTVQNQWEPFGFIGTLPNGLVFGAANQVLYKDPFAANSGNDDFLFQDNSTLIIGSASVVGTAGSTNTMDQRLQVHGGAYFRQNVGIGTTTPTASLNVVGNVGITGIVTIGTASVVIDGDRNRINVGFTSISSGIITSTSGIVTYYGDGQYLINIDSSKWDNVAAGLGTGIYSRTLRRVGIGTTIPQATLHVSSGVSTSVDGGLARFLAPNLGIGSITSIAIGRTFSSGTNFQSVLMAYNYFGSSASSGSYFAISHAGQGNTLVISDNDRVGVGTASPQAKLHVQGNLQVDGNVTASSQTVTANTFVGNGTIPIGGIIMWSGAISSIPTGWALCDGTAGTPDLRNRFVVGAGSATGNYAWNATTGATSGLYAPGNTGGSAAHQLSIAEMPSHTHSYEANLNVNAGDTRGGSAQAPIGANTGATGGNQYHENRPPYYALAYIMRTV